MCELSIPELKAFLDEKYEYYNCDRFIENDPISIPHLFSKKEDIEIAGFMASTIAWGNRAAIIKSARKMVEMMDYSPYEYILGASEDDIQSFSKFIYRTFNGIDAVFFIKSLKNIYKEYDGLEQVFTCGFDKSGGSAFDALSYFRGLFFCLPHEHRTEKHIANVEKNASAKRLCMFLRWMVRHDPKGVDFGIWHNIKTSKLMLPLDVHSGNISRKLGLLNRKQNDWKAVIEVTDNLRKFDADDPVKYDFSLFGLGVNHDF